jgi:hypothetical protein
LATTVLAAAVVIALQPASALGAQFQRGDVFFSASGSVREWSPSGQLIQTVPGTSGATFLCFDPSGQHLVVPGVGLFGSAGNELPSNWAAVTGFGCVADGLGDVFVYNTNWTVTKYSLTGTATETFALPALPGPNGMTAFDLAPDECTAYYGAWGEVNLSSSGIGRFNVCSNTPESLFNHWDWSNDLRVLPDWRVISIDDAAGDLFDPFGQGGGFSYPAGLPIADHLRFASLDPDGRSVWISGGVGTLRFDVDTGQEISEWLPAEDCGMPGWTYTCSAAVPDRGNLAVYGPPLLGDANVELTAHSETAGTAQAFLASAAYDGKLSGLHLYADSSTTASEVIVGIYSDRSGRPGALEADATIAAIRPGSWNYVTVPSLPVTAAHRYWIAVLAPSGGGRLTVRDSAGGGTSETSASRTLTRLPDRWSTGRGPGAARLSSFGS